MKKIFIFIVLALLLTSFIIAENNENQNINQNEDDNSDLNETEDNEDEELAKGKIREKNKLKIKNQTEECPEDCTCTGSTIKCEFEGGRTMTIRAGNSGNIIVQVKNANMSTQVTLYKSNNSLYGIFKGNKTKEIKILPDQVQEKIIARIRAKLGNQTIELDENGIYQVQTKKRARLFFLIPVREKVRIEVNAETGEIIKIRNPWWGFLAKDIEEETQ